MKKVLWRIAACVAVVLLSFSVYSCKDDDEVGSLKDLIGIWEITEATLPDGSKAHPGDSEMDELRIGFQENGVLIYYEEYRGSWREEFRGTYTYSGGKLKLLDNDGDEIDLYGDEIDFSDKYGSNITNHSLTVKTLNGSTLSIKEETKEDGESYHYTATFQRVG